MQLIKTNFNILSFIICITEYFCQGTGHWRGIARVLGHLLSFLCAARCIPVSRQLLGDPVARCSLARPCITDYDRYYFCNFKPFPAAGSQYSKVLKKKEIKRLSSLLMPLHLWYILIPRKHWRDQFNLNILVRCDVPAGIFYVLLLKHP